MKINRPLLFVAILVALGIVEALFVAPVLKNFSSQSATSAKKVIYYCPMHPTYTSKEPGVCPICHMTLVKREMTEAAAEEMPATSKAKHTGHQAMMETSEDSQEEEVEEAKPKVFTVQQLMNMKPHEICLLHKCKMGQCMIAMTPEFARLGKCPHCGEDLGVIVKDAVPQGYSKIQLGVEKQQTIGVKTTPVQKIALTKTIRSSGRIAYDPELYQAEEEYLQAAQALKKAETADPEIKAQEAKLVDSAKIKLRLLGLSESIVQEVEKAGKPDRSLLYSDAGGKVWLYAPIYEYEMPLVHVGDPVEVEVPAITEKKITGIVRSLDSVVDPVTRSIRVRAQLENPDGVLKPEMYVTAMLKADLGKQLAVPEEAVFSTGEKNIVFVAQANNIFEPREVTLGAKADHFYQIKSGLLEGEQAVVSGNFLIDSESRLKSALENVGGGGEHVHGG